MKNNKYSSVIILMIFSLLIVIFIYYIFFTSPTQPNTPNNLEALNKRINPIGEVYIKDDAIIKPNTKIKTPSGKKIRSAKSIYDKVCSTCHNTGIANAPKFKNKNDWAARIKNGIQALTTIAINGKGAMPPRGSCSDCSDDEITSVVNYIVNNSK